MLLFRNGSDANRTSKSHETITTIMPFSWSNDPPQLEFAIGRFGNGYERRNNFDVMVEWSDVDMAIQLFADAGHPAAVKLKQELALAASIRELVSGRKRNP